MIKFVPIKPKPPVTNTFIGIYDISVDKICCYSKY